MAGEPGPFHRYAGRRVLVTGGAGFIGSNLARRLVGLGADVVLVDAFVPGMGGNRFNLQDIRDRIDLRVADVADAREMAGAVAGASVIFSLAGSVSHIDSMRHPSQDLHHNSAGPLALLEAIRRHNPAARVVYVSTRQVYGRPQSLPVDETHPARPTDVNGVNKLAAEGFHHVYHRVHQLATTILRLTNTYGPRQLIRHNRQGFLPWFVHQALLDREITLYGDGSQLRDLVAVDDVVEALLLAGEHPAAVGETLNIGGPEPLSLREIAELVVAAAGSGQISFVDWPPEKRPIDIGSFVADSSRARSLLGWQPRIHVAAGLRQMFAFYRAHGGHYFGCEDP